MRSNTTLIGHVDLQDGVDVVALQEKLGLVTVAREAVEDETVVPVVLIEALLDDLFDDVVRDQFARRNDALDARGELGMALNVPAEDVADADVDEVATFWLAVSPECPCRNPGHP